MKKVLGLLGLCLLFNAAKAQNWGGGVDDDGLHFGFTFQYISSEYKILKKKDWRNPYFDAGLNEYVTDSLAAIYSEGSPGFGIGFVTNYRLSENADVRFTPILVFNDRMVNYQYEKGENTAASFVQKKVQATMVEFPLGIKIKSDRRQNFRAYVLGGAKYSIDIVSAKKTNDDGYAPIEKFLKNRKQFFSYEAGFGLDLYFEYFKMSPEIKLSYSLNSVLKPGDHPYALPIDKLMLRHVTFSLFFE